MASSSSSSSQNWVYDVFPSFSGEDVRITFLSHFIKELDRKLIVTFKDNKIERSQSLNPALKQAIRTSRIAVVVFSEKYPSSSWCLNELVEILKCKEELGQLVIPVFYGLDPSHVRKQTGNFGEAFAKTCQNKTEDETRLWRQSLIHVANTLGYHSHNWPNEANMIEAIANEVLGKLNFTPSNDFEDFVGMEDHIAKVSDLLHLESDEVRTVGIWGSSGIGKTSIGRVLYNRLSHRFQSSIFIDRAFISKSMEIYSSANQDDYNMKLHLQKTFLSKILDKKDIKIDRLGAVEERLKHCKVLIFIDDLDEQVVLDTLAGQNQWFGYGSRIVVITKDNQILRAHGIEYIYNVCLPSEEVALKIFCRSAFRKNSPPYGLRELASEVSLLAGYLPLGLNVLGSYLRGRDKEDLMDMLPRLRNGLDGKIEKTLRVSYDGLNNQKDKAIFRHIACLFNGEKINDIKLLLADSGLDVNIGLKNLVDKSLIHVREDIVEMHSLLQDMGKEIVRAQSNEPGEREFLVDAKEICEVLEDNTGTGKVLGITLDMGEIDELHIHENAFKRMRNLLFLKLYTKKWDQKKDVRWNVWEGINYLPHKLRLLRLDGYPMKHMPSNFNTENLVKLQMSGSQLEKLWEGNHSLRGLKDIDLQDSKNLIEIPNLSKATNLETLNLGGCSSLVELPSSIRYLNKLTKLDMSGCIHLVTLPKGINLQSLDYLDLIGCSRLKIFPDISTNISWLLLSETGIETFPSTLRLQNLFHICMRTMKSEKLWGRLQPVTPLMTTLPHSLNELFISNIPSLVELPASIQNFTKLRRLGITNCINLKILPTGINFSLIDLDLSGCSRLKTFPNITTSVLDLYLSKTGIEEVPWWIEKFLNLYLLDMNGCKKLKCVSLHISKLKHLHKVEFSDCEALTKASWNDSLSLDEATATENVYSKRPVLDEASSSFPNNLISCFDFNADQEPIRFPQYSKYMRLSGEEVPSYFIHRTTGTYLTNIPMFHTSPSPPFFKFKFCAVVDPDSFYGPHNVKFHLSCRFKDRLGNTIDSHYRKFSCVEHDRKGSVLFISECSFPLNEDNASVAEVNEDHMDVHIGLDNWGTDYTYKLKGWGIRLSDDFSSPESGLDNEDTLPDVCEADEDNMVYETERREESGDSNVETERSKKRIKTTLEDHKMSL